MNFSHFRKNFTSLSLQFLTTGMLVFLASKTHVLSAELPMLEPTPQFQFSGSAGAGPLFLPSFPKQTQTYPLFQFDFLLTCRATSFCNQYQISLLRTHFDFAPSDDPYVEDPRFLIQNGSSPEHHLPFLVLKVRTFEIRPTPRLYVSFLNAELSRATRLLDESLNAQVTAAMFSVQFGKRTSGPFEGRCSFGVAGPGLKSIDYISKTIPFRGIYLLGFEQRCGFYFGNSRIQGSLSYALQSSLQVGQSGNGTAYTPGSFGALNSESQLTFEAGIWIRLPLFLQKIGFSAFTIQVPVSVRYHTNRGCLQELDQASPTCGTEATGMEIRIPILFGILLGPLQHSPSDGSAKPGPYEEPWLTPSKGL